jgi:hypothetical protein
LTEERLNRSSVFYMPGWKRVREGIVKNLLDTEPVNRDNLKVRNPKNREKLIPRRSKNIKSFPFGTCESL